jgi:hypothetical protein
VIADARVRRKERNMTSKDMIKLLAKGGHIEGRNGRGDIRYIKKCLKDNLYIDNMAQRSGSGFYFTESQSSENYITSVLEDTSWEWEYKDR